VTAYFPQNRLMASSGTCRGEAPGDRPHCRVTFTGLPCSTYSRPAKESEFLRRNAPCCAIWDHSV